MITSECNTPEYTELQSASVSSLMASRRRPGPGSVAAAHSPLWRWTCALRLAARLCAAQPLHTQTVTLHLDPTLTSQHTRDPAARRALAKGGAARALAEWRGNGHGDQQRHVVDHSHPARRVRHRCGDGVVAFAHGAAAGGRGGGGLRRRPELHPTSAGLAAAACRGGSAGVGIAALVAACPRRRPAVAVAAPSPAPSSDSPELPTGPSAVRASRKAWPFPPRLHDGGAEGDEEGEEDGKGEDRVEAGSCTRARWRRRCGPARPSGDEHEEDHALRIARARRRT